MCSLHTDFGSQGGQRGPHCPNIGICALATVASDHTSAGTEVMAVVVTPSTIIPSPVTSMAEVISRG